MNRLRNICNGVGTLSAEAADEYAHRDKKAMSEYCGEIFAYSEHLKDADIYLSRW